MSLIVGVKRAMLTISPSLNRVPSLAKAVAPLVVLQSLLIGCVSSHQVDKDWLPSDTFDKSLTGCRATSDVWIGAIVGSLTIGLVGILPLFLISTDDKLLQDGKLTASLRTMLGLACGGLLGNAFLHILPEAYATTKIHLQEQRLPIEFLGLVPVSSAAHGFNGNVYIGLWILLGIVSFIILEKLVNAVEDDDDDDSSVNRSRPCSPDVDKRSSPGTDAMRPAMRRGSTTPNPPTALNKVDPAGYLNLLVNSMDNFTHGLAVAGSFCISNHVGMLTTLAIVIHEVPHEIGDYAILIRSGFSTTQAIRSQFLTSLGGLCGACFALMSANAEHSALWILPFTAGGFMYISLCSLIPDMYEQDTPNYSWWRDPIHVVGGIALVGGSQYL